ncbi:MAG: DegV family protein [Oscillospiraceae bacterium]|nr:DegV family protein [Oscillospiraceae bacterium]
MKVRITCDSTADLSPELVEKYDIGVMPLHVIVNGETRSDGVDITPDELYANVEATGTMSTTAAINVEEYKEFFEAQKQGYDGLVHINISSGFSTCFQNATLACEEMENVFAVNSLNLSTGTGHLALDGAIMAAQGMEAKDIAAKLNEMAPKLDVSFILDTLKYLHLGGRCSGVAALGANLLGLKPCIQVKDGGMVVGKKYRGKSEVCIRKYMEDKLRGRDDLDLRRIFITHSGIEPEIIEDSKKLVASIAPFEEILVTRAGCTVSNHCGPRTIGVLFYTK